MYVNDIPRSVYAACTTLPPKSTVEIIIIILFIIIIMRYMGIGQDMIIFLSSRGDLNVALQHHAGYERDC